MSIIRPDGNHGSSITTTVDLVAEADAPTTPDLENLNVSPPSADGVVSPTQRSRLASKSVWGLAVVAVIAVIAAVLTPKWFGMRDDLDKTRAEVADARGDIADLEQDLLASGVALETSRAATVAADARFDRVEAERDEFLSIVEDVEDFLVTAMGLPPEPVAEEDARCLLGEMGVATFLDLSVSSLAGVSQVRPELAGEAASAWLTCGLTP